MKKGRLYIFISIVVILISFNLLNNILNARSEDLSTGSENLIEDNTPKELQIRLLVSENEGGSVFGGGTIKKGNEILIEAKVEENYIFDGWYLNGELLSSEPKYKFTPEKSMEIQAKFILKDIQYLAVDPDNILTLVTKNVSLGNYRPSDLVELPKYLLSRPQWRYYLRKEAAYYLEKMWEDAKEQGITLYVASAFRDYETQKQIYNNHVLKYGEEMANRVSAKPGTSEHQLGTTVDFVDRPEGTLSQSFANTPAGKWLMENAYKYGFVLSYPEGKESITGYIFEPWHYRYIGVDKAKAWKESGLTLNQFLKELPQNLIKLEATNTNN
ncbi:LD-carboxypeptidase LdcB, LAS superfamily [Anaerobranca californiensis DSM 14826]|jgi:D-alanyl-D-alanine carboxypeptidase|uniref:LD-carboxypeptidase LdcB, LAS superfamily n=1 Tax=Anaerobranca californiensis DSM 14826 TaxID=1120989 RepID=A0A1M6QVW7_9FIRM|nr:D-alanyl-D-alanine carboxypeptidase family protein [Anaerobranca californiensis]SHK24409.1 LD-carboxypeptidase LdcB, LAS superfamily [Anaerobranca californiensis DSM 14826]